MMGENFDAGTVTFMNSLLCRKENAGSKSGWDMPKYTTTFISIGINMVGVCAAVLAVLLIFSTTDIAAQPNLEEVKKASDALRACNSSNENKQKCGYLAIKDMLDKDATLHPTKECASDEHLANNNIINVDKCIKWLITASAATQSADSKLDGSKSQQNASAVQEPPIQNDKPAQQYADNSHNNEKNSKESPPASPNISHSIFHGIDIDILVVVLVVTLVAIPLYLYKMARQIKTLKDQAEGFSLANDANSTKIVDVGKLQQDVEDLSKKITGMESKLQNYLSIIPEKENKHPDKQRAPFLQKHDEAILKAICHLAQKFVSITEANFTAKVTGCYTEAQAKSELAANIEFAHFFSCDGMRTAQGPELIAYRIKGQSTCHVVPFPTAGRVGQFIKWFENATGTYKENPVLAAIPATGTITTNGTLSIVTKGRLAS